MKSTAMNRPQSVPSRIQGSSMPSWLPVAALLGAVTLWGASFTAMRVAVAELLPMSVMWLRMLIALAVILPFAKKINLRAYRKGDWKALIPMVLFQPCLYFLLESNALRFTTSSQAGVISAAVPLLVAVGAWLALSERISSLAIAGLLLSVAGVAGLSLYGAEDARAVNPLLGNGLELGAMACAAANIILVKRLSGRYNPWLMTAMQVAAGVIFFSPGAIPLFQGGFSAITLPLLAILVFLGACVTFGAFGLYNWAMCHIPASRAAVFINLVPVFAIILGWILLNERLSPLQMLSAACVFLGVWLARRS